MTKALSNTEARALIHAAREVHYPAGTAVMFGMYLALRASEIAAARWDRFDARREWYTVDGAKGGGQSALPVHQALRDALAELDRDGDNPFIFPGNRGRLYVTPATVWTWVNGVADRAGVEGMHPHRMRHTALSVANDSTTDLRAVSAFARHASLETTVGYTRTRQQALEKVMRSLDYDGLPDDPRPLISP